MSVRFPLAMAVAGECRDPIYLVATPGYSHFALGRGSSVPDEGDALFARIAERFEFLGG